MGSPSKYYITTSQHTGVISVTLIFRLSTFFHFGNYGISQLSTGNVLLIHSHRNTKKVGRRKKSILFGVLISWLNNKNS